MGWSVSYSVVMDLLMKKYRNLPIAVRVFDWEIRHFSVSAAIKTKDNAETAQSKLHTVRNGSFISIGGSWTLVACVGGSGEGGFYNAVNGTEWMGKQIKCPHSAITIYVEHLGDSIINVNSERGQD